jgi:CBS domain-containing protein
MTRFAWVVIPFLYGGGGYATVATRRWGLRTYRVADWMSTPPILIRSTTTLADAQRIMEHRKVRRLPVVEDGRLVAIVTWGDLRAAQPSAATTLSIHEWRALLERATVAESMTREPVTIAPNAMVFDAAQRMLDHKIGGLPVVAEGRVVGVITESDLLRLLIADATGTTDHAHGREALVCGHCGAVLRGRSFANLGPDDACWHCHFHLHRCENCQYFDRITCLLDRDERREAIPGQHCPAFAYLPMRAASLGAGEH